MAGPTAIPFLMFDGVSVSMHPHARGEHTLLSFFPLAVSLSGWNYIEPGRWLPPISCRSQTQWHGELEQQRLWDLKNQSRAKYDHIWEDAFNDTVEDSIIQAEWFDSAIDAHIIVGRAKRIVTVGHAQLIPSPVFPLAAGNQFFQRLAIIESAVQ